MRTTKIFVAFAILAAAASSCIDRPFRAMTARRFAPPWLIEDIGACFIVKDSRGQKLASCECP